MYQNNTVIGQLPNKKRIKQFFISKRPASLKKINKNLYFLAAGGQKFFYVLHNYN